MTSTRAGNVYENINIHDGTNHLGDKFVNLSLQISSESGSRNEDPGPFSSSFRKPVPTYVQRASLYGQLSDRLHSATEDGRPAAKVVVVRGLGGTGKSQLVLGYLEEFGKEYSATFWIEADQRQTLDRDFVQLYQHLYDIDAIAAQAVKPEAAVQAVKSWFQTQTRQCLLVFDGADALDKTDSLYIDLPRYIPNSDFVHVIITTRNPKACEMTALKPVLVDQMEETEAAELFFRHAGIDRPSVEDKSETERIVSELGYLALAIALAGSYVKETHIGLQEYLPKYHQYRSQLLGEAASDLAGAYGRTVFSTWEPSLEAVRQRNPDACCLLSLLSCLHFDNIFLDLFSSPVTESADSEAHQERTWMDIVLGRKVDAVAIKAAFRPLQAFSLIQWKPGQRSFWMHKLVHAWGYERLDKQQRALFSLAGLQLLQGLAGKETQPWLERRLVPHITANFATVSSIYSLKEFERETPLSLLDSTAYFLKEAGILPEAFTIREFHIGQITRIYGKEHPDTLSSMHRLGIIYRELSMLERSKSTLEEVLEQRRKTLGEDDPTTFVSMSSLSNALIADGKFADAALLLQDAIERSKRLFGGKNRETIRCMRMLSATLFYRGKLSDAETMYKEALDLSIEVLGEMDLETVDIEDGLATAVAQLGLRDEPSRLQEASFMQKKLLKKLEKLYGESHPATLQASLNHSVTLGYLNNHEEEEAIQVKALEMIEKTLGGDHLLAMNARIYLTLTLRDCGKLKEAAELGQLAVEKSTRNFGKDHLNTVTAMRSLAQVLCALGKWSKAALMFKRVLNVMKRDLGKDHFRTINCKEWLAYALGNLDEKELAAFNIQE